MRKLEMEMDSDTEEVVVAKMPFRFFDLPYELRLRVYELILVLPKAIDLDPTNCRAISPRLRPFLVSHRMHEEAYRVFYARNTFRVFPIHGRFIHTKTPLLAKLSPRYRAAITKLELRLGPGWNKPPKGWVVDNRLGLADIAKGRLLKIFVECDPASDATFEGFRLPNDFFTEFCVGLVCDLIVQVPSLVEVELDANPGISKTSPLVQRLVNVVKANDKRILWGPERGWDQIVEVNLASFLEKLCLSAP